VRRPAGFTLVEALIGLALALFILAAGVEFFGQAERAFLRLRAREEAGQATLAALDRIRIDLLHAGRGLATETDEGLVEPVLADAAGLNMTSAETSVTYFVDSAHILRRRVNGGSAQPVLEDIRAADWTYEPETHLARVRLEADVEGAHPHEATIFVKNAALR
jgi:type II secretory pathway pseudopilin PulG